MDPNEPVTGYARPEYLATVDWLAEQGDRPEVRILDARWRPDGTGRAAYLAGHIPGAVHLDWRADLTEPDEWSGPPLLAGPDRVAGALSRSGVGDGSTVVVYDDLAGLYAARVWWSLRSYGLAAVRILNGGYPDWLAAGRPVSSAVPSLEPTTFTPRAQPRMRLTTSEIRGVLGSPDVLILDARAPAEFDGQQGSGRRLGHIPGAVNLPAVALAAPDGQHLLDGDLLRAMLTAREIGRDRRLVCYDAGGITATKLAFVLAVLGHDDVAVYDGGWSEWSDRLDLPVER